MAAATGLATTTTTPKARVSYPNIFKPQLNKLAKKMEYSVQALFENPLAHADFTELKTLARNACINKWGPDEKQWPTNVARAEAIAKWGNDPSKWEVIPPILKLPFKKQDELIAAAVKKNQAHDHLKAGALYMTFKTAATDKNGAARPHPRVVDKNPKVEITEPAKFYAGCWAKFNVTAAAYANGANFGVSFYLNAAQFVADAPAFGNAFNPETAFEAIPEDAVAPEGDAGGAAPDMFS